jgi:hypothetical protein
LGVDFPKLATANRFKLRPGFFSKFQPSVSFHRLNHFAYDNYLILQRGTKPQPGPPVYSPGAKY